MQNKKVLLALIGLLLVGGGAYFYMQNVQKKTVEMMASPTPAVEASMMPNASTSPATQLTSRKINAVLMSDSSSGATASPLSSKTAFSTQTATIFATVQLDPSYDGDKVVLKITYAADKSELGPVNAQVKTQDGKKFAVFQMKKPANGWPAGSYTALFALTTGESLEVPFTIQ